MLKVNNKRTIHRLAQNSFKANKMRNIFAVVSIILTTVLFTGLFTVASSLLSSMEESTMRQVGGNAHGIFKYISIEQYDKLKSHPSIKEISYSVVLGIAENQELAKRPTEIRYTSGETNAKGVFSLPTTGRLPQRDDEMATDTIVLKRLGIPAEIGQKITIEYTLNTEKKSDTFTLVGFWEGDSLMSASQLWLNRSYVEKQLENYHTTDKYDLIGKLNADVNFANSFQIEDKMIKVLTDSGYMEDEIAYGVNWAYTGNSGNVDVGTILGVLIIILMIVFCGYLIISNVFYISVSKDIRFYGLLKTIGTTGKQIRFLIRRQALLLCAIGVPLGLISGVFVGGMVTPLVLSVLNTNVIHFYIHPIVFMISALFAIFTVVISISKPSKIAAIVSPIEALRNTDGALKSKKTTRKSGGVSLLKMAIANVFRNKKKVVIVTISLSLSLIILNFAYSMANSFDMDKYLRLMIGSDFKIGDVACFNVHMYYSDQDTLSPSFLEGIRSKNGVEKLNNIYFQEFRLDTDSQLLKLPTKLEKELAISEQEVEDVRNQLKNPLQPAHIYGLDVGALDQLIMFDGEIDQEKLNSGDYIIAAPYGKFGVEQYDTEGYVNYYNVGDKVILQTSTGESHEYEVLAIAVIPYNISVQHFHLITTEFYLPSEVFLSNIEDKEPMLTTVNVADSGQIEMEEYLRNYCANIDSAMQYISKATLSAEYENTQSTYKSVGTIISLLVAFIGIMNFINTIITSIMARKRELAMLQSIGMTNRQLDCMLVFEGLSYTAATAIFVITIGSVLGYLILHSFIEGGSYFTLKVTIIPALLCLPILAIISVLVPFISQYSVNRHSVVERLREVE